MADSSPYPDGDDTGARAERESPPYPGMPRWVKVFGIVIIVLILLVIIVMLAGVGGEHGPGRHMPSGDTGGPTPPTGYGMQHPRP